MQLQDLQYKLKELKNINTYYREVVMYPNPQVLTALLHHYINKRQELWNSYWQTLAHIGSFITWSKYESPEERTKNCENIEKIILSSTTSELDKWISLCIDLGKTADEKNSLISKYCHALRTKILADINSDDATKSDLNQNITELKTSLKMEESKSTRDIIHENVLLKKLAYLGDSESIRSAMQAGIIKGSAGAKTDALFLEYQADYFSGKFFAEQIKPGTALESFNQFVETALAKIKVKIHTAESPSTQELKAEIPIEKSGESTPPIQDTVTLNESKEVNSDLSKLKSSEAENKIIVPPKPQSPQSKSTYAAVTKLGLKTESVESKPITRRVIYAPVINRKKPQRLLDSERRLVEAQQSNSKVSEPNVLRQRFR